MPGHGCGTSLQEEGDVFATCTDRHDGSRFRAADRTQRCMWDMSPGKARNRDSLGKESGLGPVWREVEGKVTGADGGKGEVT